MGEQEKPYQPRVSKAIGVTREIEIEPSDIAFGGADAVYDFIVDIDNLAQSWPLTLRLASYFDEQRKRHTARLPRLKTFWWTFTVDGIVVKRDRGSGPWDIGASTAADLRLAAVVAPGRLRVSAQHAQIFVDVNGVVRVRDVAPSNLSLYSTRVCRSGQLVPEQVDPGSESAPLSSGESIEIGPHRITVEFSEANDAPPAGRHA